MIVSNYRINSIDDLMEKYKLSTVTTGVAMDSYMAVSRQGSDLYAILNKIINLVPDTAMNAALASYSYGDQKVTLARFVRENMIPVLALVGVILTIILVLMVRSRRSEKKTREAMEQIAVLNKEQKDRIYEIAMTANAFDEDVQKSLQAGMDAHLSKPVEPDHLYQTLEELVGRND